MARKRRGQVGLQSGTVGGDIAGVHDQVGRRSGERRRHDVEVLHEERLVAAEVAVGELGDAERHGLVPSSMHDKRDGETW
jgi:hypothetical protein